jgi:hypothetical protein
VSGRAKPRPQPRAAAMNPREAVGRYYDAWHNKAADFSEVPLARGELFYDGEELRRAMAQTSG